MDCATLYVSPAGNDRWGGGLADPNPEHTDGPFATLTRARDELRRLRAAGELEGRAARILVRGGVYELDEPFTLTAADSGTAEAPVVYAAFPGEVPVLSGGRRLRTWSAGAVEGRACWVADLPEVRAGRWFFTQLFVNGGRRFRPRLPKHGYYRFASVAAGGHTPWLEGPSEAKFRTRDLQDWRHRDDVKVVALQLWFEAHHRIKALDLAANTVTFRAKSLGSLIDEKGLPARYFVENVFEALNEPGEFYLDRAEGRLYYLPLPGEEMAAAEVVAPRLAEILVFAGRPDAEVRHVRIENFAFRHAEWEYGPDDPGSIQAAWKVPGAVVFDWATDCVLYGCEVSHVAQYGVEVRTGSAGNRIVACTLFDLGGGGVRIGHEALERSNETHRGTLRGRADGRPMETTVSDCEIRDGSRIHYQAVSVWIGNSGCNRILRNHIHDMNYTGVSCGWTWGYAPTATVDNRIEFNHIHHINWDRILSDNGGIYTLGIQPGTTLRGNLIHHIGCYHYGGWGIYPDEGSSGIRIEGNIVHDTDDAGFSTHYGRDNLVRNNIFALARAAHVNPGKQEAHRTTVFTGNIVWWRGCGFRNAEWPRGHFLFSRNLFWDGVGGDLDLGGGVRLSEWQALGQHSASVVADPLFRAPEAGDFTLREDSPAVAIGFRPFTLAGLVGPRGRRGVRPAAYEEWPDEALARPRPIVHSRLEETPGGAIRLTLTNLGRAVAGGRVRLVVSPPEAVQFRRRPLCAVEGLQPGETRTVEFAVKRRRPLAFVTVETVVSGAGFVPTLEFLGRPPEWRVPRLEAVSTVERVFATLAGLSRQPVQWARSLALAEVALAVAGEDLAVLVKVKEARLVSGPRPWEGSCVELFLAGAGERTEAARAAAPGELRQVFLVPPVSGQPVRVAFQDGDRQAADPSLRVAARLTADGYEVAALLPLAFLRIGARADALLAEVAVTAHRAGGARLRGTLFGAPRPYCSPAGYGTVQVEDR